MRLSIWVNTSSRPPRREIARVGSGARGLSAGLYPSASLPMRAYHEALWEAIPPGLTPPELELRRRFLLERVRAGERVLDVGCGEGFLMSALVRAGVQAIGLDVAEEPLRRARARDPALTDLRLA